MSTDIKKKIMTLELDIKITNLITLGFTWAHLRNELMKICRFCCFISASYYISTYTQKIHTHTITHTYTYYCISHTNSTHTWGHFWHTRTWVTKYNEEGGIRQEWNELRGRAKKVVDSEGFLKVYLYTWIVLYDWGRNFVMVSKMDHWSRTIRKLNRLQKKTR